MSKITRQNSVKYDQNLKEKELFLLVFFVRKAKELIPKKIYYIILFSINVFILFFVFIFFTVWRKIEQIETINEVKRKIIKGLRG